jgi:hypothetical protein
MSLMRLADHHISKPNVLFFRNTASDAYHQPKPDLFVFSLQLHRNRCS